MGKYELECRIKELENKIQECYTKIVSNNKLIARFEQAHDSVRTEKQNIETRLYDQRSSFIALERFKTKRIITLSASLQKICSEQKIAEVLENTDGICQSIEKSVDELDEKNRLLREEIKRCENEIANCRGQIAEIEREEREEREREEREREERERRQSLNR